MGGDTDRQEDGGETGGRARRKVQSGRERERLSGGRTGEQTNGRRAEADTRLLKKGFNLWAGLPGPRPGPAPGPSLRIMVLQDLDSQTLGDDQHAERHAEKLFWKPGLNAAAAATATAAGESTQTSGSLSQSAGLQDAQSVLHSTAIGQCLLLDLWTVIKRIINTNIKAVINF